MVIQSEWTSYQSYNVQTILLANVRLTGFHSSVFDTLKFSNKKPMVMTVA